MRRILIAVTFCLAFFFLPHAGAVTRPADDNLTREFAKFRKSQIRSVNYQLSFVLNKGATEFSGSSVLDVELARTDSPLSIDFVAKKIAAVRVNGAPVTDYVVRTGSFDIPARHLQSKSRKSVRIEVDYVAEFSKDGAGFQRVVDPEDGAEYIYSDSEPYDAHRLFPCFDQPDLRATYVVSVDAPSDWNVISNDLPEETKSDAGRAQTRFRRSQSFSTYLFFLGAGPFVEWKDQAGSLPLYLYARKSLAKYVDAERIFATTKKGLEFYNSYFDFPYPFPKYGQVLVPDFSHGGMENPGAITLNERNIFRGPVSQSRLNDRDDLILHEMAHMWFGDLVTMSWWDDLWLNESFASYMAALSADRAMKHSSAWVDFFASKSWGYWQDQLVTTHPIESNVPDIRTAKGNFDGITYAKGAATLKQLHFLAGEEGFRDGVRAYFKKFAFQNSHRADFIASVSTAAKRDLAGWTKAWLQSAGPHRVQAKWSCKDQVLDSLTLTQSPNASKVLSPHRTRLGLFKINSSGVLELTKSQELYYDKAQAAVKEVKGVPCPSFVYPNIDDQDYALVALDAESLKVTKEALAGAVSDPLLRLMIWQTLQQMVRDAQISVDVYFDMALAALERETNESVLGVVLGRHSTLREYFYEYFTPEQRAAAAPRLEELIWKRLGAETAGSGLQMTLFDFYVAIAQTPAANTRLSAALSGQAVPKGLVIDQDRRWLIVTQLATNGAGGSLNAALDLIAAEEKVDPSSTGKRNAFAARVALPDAESKIKFWNDLQSPGQISHSTLRAAAKQFHKSNQTQLSLPFQAKFFERIAAVDWAANDSLVEIYFEDLFPHNLCSDALLAVSKLKLRGANKLNPLVKRAWLEANDELAKCISVRKKARAI